MEENTGRVPPHDDQAERGVLGAVLINNEVLNTVSDKLVVSDFYSNRNGDVYAAILDMSAKSEPIDYLTLADEMGKRGSLASIGGLPYLMELTQGPIYTSNAGAYADIVLEKSILRRLIFAADLIGNKAYEQKEEVSAIIEEAERRIFDITQANHKDGLSKLAEILQQTLSQLEQMSMLDGQLTGVTTGFKDLDTHLSGLQKSDLVLLAARPSMGKTALGVNIALNAAIKKHKVAIFSLEMSKLQLSQRLLSSVSLVNLQKIISGDIDDWKDIGDSIAFLSQIELFVDDTASISLTELRAKCRRMKAEDGLELVVIDYLQLMTADTQFENRQQEISTISRGLKALAKEIDAPVLALAQLSRAPEQRADHRPILSDLRESGAIEQDADVVMMLYRDDYYHEDSDRPNTADVIIAKHRNGPTGTVELYFNKEITKFGDIVYGRDN